MSILQRDSKGRFMPGNTLGHRFRSGEEWDGNSKGRPIDSLETLEKFMEHLAVPKPLIRAYRSMFECNPDNMASAVIGQIVRTAFVKGDNRGAIVLLKLAIDACHKRRQVQELSPVTPNQEITVNVITTRQLPEDNDNSEE